MNTLKRSIAATEVLLIFPAVLFMSALFVRNIQPQQFEPAHTAARIVMWYASLRGTGLWLFLIAFPLAVLISGCSVVVRSWKSDAELRQGALQTVAVLRAHLATLLVTVATAIAGCVLAIVAVHLIAD